MKEEGFSEKVLSADPLLTLVLSNQLWMEHLLIEILKLSLPNPKPLFKNRYPTFLNLITLCECQNILDQDMADILRKLNNQRNKYAHKLSHQPDLNEITEIQKSLREIKEPFFISRVPASKKEFAIMLASISGFLESKYNDLLDNR